MRRYLNSPRLMEMPLGGLVQKFNIKGKKIVRPILKEKSHPIQFFARGNHRFPQGGRGHLTVYYKTVHEFFLFVGVETFIALVGLLTSSVQMFHPSQPIIFM